MHVMWPDQMGLGFDQGGIMAGCHLVQSRAATPCYKAAQLCNGDDNTGATVYGGRVVSV